MKKKKSRKESLLTLRLFPHVAHTVRKQNQIKHNKLSKILYRRVYSLPPWRLSITETNSWNSEHLSSCHCQVVIIFQSGSDRLFNWGSLLKPGIWFWGHNYGSWLPEGLQYAWGYRKWFKPGLWTVTFANGLTVTFVWEALPKGNFLTCFSPLQLFLIQEEGPMCM